VWRPLFMLNLLVSEQPSDALMVLVTGKGLLRAHSHDDRRANHERDGNGDKCEDSSHKVYPLKVYKRHKNNTRENTGCHQILGVAVTKP
jgi:hypothetical protein